MSRDLHDRIFLKPYCCPTVKILHGMAVNYVQNRLDGKAPALCGTPCWRPVEWRRFVVSCPISWPGHKLLLWAGIYTTVSFWSHIAVQLSRYFMRWLWIMCSIALMAKRRWATLWNDMLMSIRMASICCLLSNSLVRSWTVVMSWDLHDRLFLKPYCWPLSVW